MIDDKAKFERFTSALYDEANQSVKKIVGKSKIKYDEIVSSAQKEANEKAEEYKKTNLSNIEAKYSNLVSVASLDTKKELLSFRKKLVDELFDEITTKLNKFVQSEAYISYLEKIIINSYKDCEVKIAFSPKDFARATSLSKNFPLKKCEFIEDKSIFIGGMKIFVKNITDDQTLDSKLLDKRSEFNQKSSLYID